MLWKNGKHLDIFPSIILIFNSTVIITQRNKKLEKQTQFKY